MQDIISKTTHLDMHKQVRNTYDPPLQYIASKSTTHIHLPDIELTFTLLLSIAVSCPFLSFILT